MVVKYYAQRGENENNPYTEVFFLIDPYQHKPLSPSYCVWIVPGTTDEDGHDNTDE